MDPDPVRLLSLQGEGRPHEDTGTRRLSTSRERGPQNGEKINSCCLSHAVLALCYGSPSTALQLYQVTRPVGRNTLSWRCDPRPRAPGKRSNCLEATRLRKPHWPRGRPRGRPRDLTGRRSLSSPQPLSNDKRDLSKPGPSRQAPEPEKRGEITKRQLQ